MVHSIKAKIQWALGQFACISHGHPRRFSFFDNCSHPVFTVINPLDQKSRRKRTGNSLWAGLCGL